MTTITKEAMVAYLQSMMDDFENERFQFGMQDRVVMKKFDKMVACKEMVEAMLGEPVNLDAVSGKVTVGM